MSLVEFKDVSKIYKSGESEIKAADKISLNIEEGEFCVVVGPSGAGKTTVLNMLGGMETVTSGEIFVNGEKISSFGGRQLAFYRRNEVGFVFQFYNLIQNLTAKENVEIASEICKNPLDSVKTLEAVGLTDRLNNFPSQLSGGEQQRVSIARAIAKNPRILLCDEPTGALDYETGKKILKLLKTVCKEMNKTVIVITHNSAITKMADRIIKIKNGRVEDMYLNEAPVEAETLEW